MGVVRRDIVLELAQEVLYRDLYDFASVSSRIFLINNHAMRIRMVNIPHSNWGTAYISQDVRQRVTLGDARIQ